MDEKSQEKFGVKKINNTKLVFNLTRCVHSCTKTHPFKKKNFNFAISFNCFKSP